MNEQEEVTLTWRTVVLAVVLWVVGLVALLVFCSGGSLFGPVG